jgi:hypothetical protein
MFITMVAVSILEKLQVPEGWCSSGRKAKEYVYTLVDLGKFHVPNVPATPEFRVPVWCW